MLVGAIIGSGKDQNKDRIRMLKEQYDHMEERNLYLSDLYNNALQNKEQFKDQIVGYKDSFGRLYDVTLKLNNTMPEAVFKEALEVMEDILNNKSIAIYTLSSGSSYARLNLCSKPLNNKLMRSISLDSYNEMSKDLKDGAVWFNKEYLEGYPIYCAPIYKQEELVSLVMIYEVSYAQLAMYYVNLIRIICGLLQNSLVRAIDYEGMAGQDIYYENTMIMKKERFAELLNVKNELQEKDFSNYILLRLNIKSDDLKEISDMVVSRVRVSDVIGIGPDDKVYLILSQVTDDNAEYAYKRLLQAGISFKRVSTAHLMKRQESI